MEDLKFRFKLCPRMRNILILKFKLYRETSELCDIAVLYTALEKTVLTKTQLKLFDLDGMRELMGQEMNMGSVKGVPNLQLVKLFYNCEYVHKMNNVH